MVHRCTTRRNRSYADHLSKAFQSIWKQLTHFEDILPKPYQEFKDILTKEYFYELPDQKHWDHTIELIPETQTFSTKVYPLSPVKQKQLGEFLNENLKCRCIHPSKFTNGISCILHQKEGRQPSPHPGLP